MKMKEIWNGPALLGESPLWHHKEQALYWVDILDERLFRMQFDSGEVQQWKMPGVIGCIAQQRSGGLIAGIKNTICQIEMPTGSVSTLCELPTDLRTNDGKCDREGRFWIGTACSEEPLASLYRFDEKGCLHKMQNHIFISNGLGWSVDNKIFYYTDSLARTIWAYDYDAASGDITNRRTLIVTPDNEGVPDGLTVDANGNIWSARYDGGKICCYSPEGHLIHEIEMPVQRPTSCMFGGPNLDILYVTSCSRDFKEREPLSKPAGSVFAIDVGATGIPEPAYQG